MQPHWSQEERELRIGWELSAPLRQRTTYRAAIDNAAVRAALRAAGRAELTKHHKSKQEEQPNG